jgi:hypothetical protein
MNDKKEYLGDGLYATFDGWGIWLTAEDGVSVQNKVYLEPHVLKTFDEYVARLRQFIKVESEKMEAERNGRNESP